MIPAPVGIKVGRVRNTTATLLLSVVAASCGSSQEFERPNVLLITVDTLRADHLTPYGYERTTSPYLDELARESTVFGDALSQCGTTPQSLSSIMTGMYPYTDEVVTKSGPFTYLRPEAAPLAERLSQAGYRTHAITSSVQSSRMTGLDAGFASFDSIEVGPEGTKKSKRRGAVEISELGREWLGANAGVGEPFFLWLHYLDPHYPYAAEAEYDELFGVEPFEPGATRNYRFDEKKSASYPLSDGELRELVREYDREIRATDDALRDVLETMPEGLLERTLVVFTADHGEALGHRGIISHNELYQSIVHVPLIVRFPGASRAARVDEPVMLVDVVPTILDCVGLPVDPRLRGTSLRERPSPGRLRVAEYADKKAYLADGWKWIRRRNREEVYSLAQDPSESRDLQDSSGAEGASLAGLRASVQRLSPRPPGSAVSAPTVEPTAEAIQELHDLGYTGDE